jgi:subtilase family serine protease
MVPDVSADADPYTGYELFVHGAGTTLGGTSAVAPLYTGLFAAFGRKLGYVTPTLWLNQTCFNDITSGDNGYYRARVGPDPCTGLGTPIANKLATLFGALTKSASVASASTAGEKRTLASAVARGRRTHGARSASG